VVPEIAAITNQLAGRKLQIVYGSVTASINPRRSSKVHGKTIQPDKPRDFMD
jgi:hypothetical protein